jgi:hypothetical protein
MNASKKNLVGKFGIFATRVGIVACLIQLTSLWLPVVQYKMQNPNASVFVKTNLTSTQGQFI